MIQGGDPEGTGMGGPGYKFADETKTSTQNFKEPGKLAMAQLQLAPTPTALSSSSPSPTPAGSPSKHTIFGEVVEGYDIVEKIAAK